MKSKKDVVLVFAGKSEKIPRLPISTLTLGAYIRKYGFNPILIDMRKDDYKKFKIDWDKVLAVGISSLSGPPLSAGLNFAKMVRSEAPNVPIVWGGPHASFFPEQTVESKYVDYVVRSEGEITLLNLLRAFQRGGSVDKIKGLSYIREGKPVSTSDEEFLDMETLPLPAYDLIDMADYLQGTGNKLSYETSRGCPFRCTFCYTHSFHKCKWRAKSVNKIMSDIKHLVKTYNPKEIFFTDDNLFVDKTKVLQIAKGVINEKLKFIWSATIRADCLSRCSIEELKLLKESGCTSLSLGVESGSERVLKMIRKDITKEEVRESIRRCVAADMMLSISLIVGLPGETRADINETLDFYDEMNSLNTSTTQVNPISISIYSPYPGTPIFKEACSLGYKPFTKLEDWSTWQMDDPKYVPWYSSRYRKNLDLISSLSRFRYFYQRIAFYPKEYKKSKLGSPFNVLLYDLLVPLFKLDANLRWKYRLLSYSPEWKLFDLARAKFIKAK